MPFKLWRMGFRGTFYFVDHHHAHAASAFLVSPYESAAILTSTCAARTARRSSAAATAIASRRIRRFYLPHSLGIFYAALTQFLGYAPTTMNTR